MDGWITLYDVAKIKEDNLMSFTTDVFSSGCIDTLYDREIFRVYWDSEGYMRTYVEEFMSNNRDRVIEILKYNSIAGMTDIDMFALLCERYVVAAWKLWT